MIFYGNSTHTLKRDSLFTGLLPFEVSSFYTALHSPRQNPEQFPTTKQRRAGSKEGRAALALDMHRTDGTPLKSPDSISRSTLLTRSLSQAPMIAFRVLQRGAGFFEYRIPDFPL